MLMWDPYNLSQDLIENYIQKVGEFLNKKRSQIEEIALYYLVKHNHNYIEALFAIKENPAEIRKLIQDASIGNQKQQDENGDHMRQINYYSGKDNLEFIKYIVELTSN